jgi:hypothetical protein
MTHLVTVSVESLFEGYWKPGWIAAGAVGFYHLARTIATQCRRKIEAPPVPPHAAERWANAQAFQVRIPVLLSSMTREELAAYNENQVVKFSLEGGCRIGISINAVGMSPFQIRCTLKLFHEKYSQATRIELIGYSGDGADLAPQIIRFESLSNLAFRDCATLGEKAVEEILACNRAIDRINQTIRIKQLHVSGCSSLSAAFCMKMAEQYALLMTFPNGRSNEAELRQKFNQYVKETLLGCLDDLIHAAEGTPGHIPLVTLKDKLVRRRPKEEVRAALETVFGHLNPAPADLKNRLQRARGELPKHAALFDLPFPLILRYIIAEDAMLEELLEALQNDFLAHLDVSDSTLTGQFLRKLKGTAVSTLVACRLRKFSNDALDHLSGLPELVRLDLSGCPLQDIGLLRGIKRLVKIQTLKLNHCTTMTEVGMRKAIPPLIAKSLVYLSLEGIPNIKREFIAFLIMRGGEDPSRPFFITSTVDQKRRLDIAKSLSIDDALVEALREVGSEPVQILGFWANTELKVGDINRLHGLPVLRVEQLDLTDVKIEDEAMRMLGHHWPLKKILFTDVEVIIEGDKISVVAKQFSLRVKAFLDGLNRGAHLRLEIRSFGGRPEDRREQLLRLADLSEAKRYETLELVNTNLVNDDLVDMLLAPTPVAKRLMEACRSIKFVGGSIQPDLLKALPVA